MIADATFSNFARPETIDDLRSAGEAFDSALRRDALTDDVAEKYHSALRAYERELSNCPYSGPFSDPSADDSMTHQKLMNELERVTSEISRIGGTGISLVRDPEEESQ
jgi:hypothetical protein